MDTSSTALNGSVYDAGFSTSRTASIEPLIWIRWTEVALDVVTVLATVKISVMLAVSLSSDAADGLGSHLRAFALLLTCISVLLLDRTGAYKASGGLLRIRETASVVEATLMLTPILIGVALLIHMGILVPFLIAEVLLLAPALLLQKTLFHACLDRVRLRGLGLTRVIIYGAGATGQMLYSALTRSPKLGLSPVAIIDNDDSTKQITVHRSGYRRDQSLVSTQARFNAAFARSYQADVLIIATRPSSREDEDYLLQESAKAGAVVVYATDTATFDPAELDFMELDGHVVYKAHHTSTDAFYNLCSRFVDILISSALLLLVAAPMAVVALLIRLQSDGEVLFRQQRVGLAGKMFTIYKFRTMHTSECRDDVSPVSSVDPRITRIGRFLRKTSLDELPQLWNVLRGDMALVGPRPEMPFIVQQYTPLQRQRLRVKPGVTGIWQLSADRCRPIHENIHYDLYYLKHRSVSVDLAVLFHTLLFAVRGT